MENSGKVVIKAKYNGDIRRLTIDENIGFKELKKLLKKLYKIGHFKITYVDDEADLISIGSDMELMQAIRQASNKVVRLAIELVDAPAKSNSYVSSESSFDGNSNRRVNVSGINIEKLFEQPEFRQKMEQLVIQTVTSKHVMDTVVQILVPRLDVLTENKPLIPQKSSSSESFGFGSFIMESIPHAFQQTSADLTKVFSDVFEQKPDVPIPMEEIQEPKEIKQEQESQLKEEKVQEEEKREEPVKEAIEEKQPENPEVVDNHEEIEFPKRSSALKSFLSLVKGVVSKGPRDHQPKEEEEIEIPNMDELLEQLADMGFTDKEANIKALRFHKRYNEGIDEVIEDLLVRRNEKLQKEKEKER